MMAADYILLNLASYKGYNVRVGFFDFPIYVVDYNYFKTHFIRLLYRGFEEKELKKKSKPTGNLKAYTLVCTF